MQTKDIYTKYNLMPQLIKHQLRVAGVARLITAAWDDKRAADLAVRACLLHDMGNMAKFTGLTDQSWIEEQKKFWGKYGRDAHLATDAILSELRLDDVRGVLADEARCYMAMQPEFGTVSKPALIVLYGDLRVGMDGVVSMYERIKDLVLRYPYTSRPETEWGEKLERHVQIMTPVKLGEINEERVKSLFSDLLAMEW